MAAVKSCENQEYFPKLVKYCSGFSLADRIPAVWVRISAWELRSSPSFLSTRGWYMNGRVVGTWMGTSCSCSGIGVVSFFLQVFITRLRIISASSPFPQWHITTYKKGKRRERAYTFFNHSHWFRHFTESILKNSVQILLCIPQSILAMKLRKKKLNEWQRNYNKSKGTIQK